MANQEKLRQLFDAALKDPSELKKIPTQAFPRQVSLECAAPAHVSNSPACASYTLPVQAAPVQAHKGNLGLDQATSTEVGLLLDEQRLRLKHKRMRSSVIALASCLALTGGGVGWFVSSPQRIQALKLAVQEVRSAGNLTEMLATYQKSLDRVGKHGGHTDQATLALGGDPQAKGQQDPNMDAEMKEMMGGEGKTTGDRSKALQSGMVGKLAEDARKKAQSNIAAAPVATSPHGKSQTAPVAQNSPAGNFSVEP